MLTKASSLTCLFRFFKMLKFFQVVSIAGWPGVIPLRDTFQYDESFKYFMALH